MQYRELGSTSIKVSEIGLGCKGLLGRGLDEMKDVIDRVEDLGVNFFDLYHPDPEFRTHVGRAFLNRRERVVLQAHICPIWKDGKYQYSRAIKEVQKGFSDELRLLGTGHVEVGMIHRVGSASELDEILNGDLMTFVNKLKGLGAINVIGLSTEDTATAMMAVESGVISTIMFAANPYNDHLDADGKLTPERDPDRERLYEACREKGVGLSLMNAFKGGALLEAETSPTGIPLSVNQCLSYALEYVPASSVIASALRFEELKEAAEFTDLPEEKRKDDRFLRAYYATG